MNHSVGIKRTREAASEAEEPGVTGSYNVTILDSHRWLAMTRELQPKMCAVCVALRNIFLPTCS